MEYLGVLITNPDKPMLVTLFLNSEWRHTGANYIVLFQSPEATSMKGEKKNTMKGQI